MHSSCRTKVDTRGIEETYVRVKEMFWWPRMKKVLKRWVESCEECQKRSSRMPKELGNASGEPTLFGRVSLDVVHMKASPWKYLVVARDDLSAG